MDGEAKVTVRMPSTMTSARCSSRLERASRRETRGEGQSENSKPDRKPREEVELFDMLSLNGAEERGKVFAVGDKNAQVGFGKLLFRGPLFYR